MAHYGLGRGLDALIARKAPLPAVPPVPVLAQSPALSSAASFGATREPSAGDEQILDVLIELVEPNPDQPRKSFDDETLAELAQSIREFGVIQPLIVTEAEGRYRLIAGERRLRASKLAGRRTVPVVVRTPRQHEDVAIALIENVQREDLNPMELALAYQRLLDDYGISHGELAERIGVSRPKISNTLRLLALPEEIVQATRSGALSMYAARTIAGLPSNQKQLEFFHGLNGDHNSETMQEKVRLFTGKRHKARMKNVDPTIAHKEGLLREQFGVRVDIHRTPSGHGSVNIHYYSDEEMIDLVARLIA